MSRITKPVFKTSRRLSFSILESGKEFSKGKQRQYAPGQHGPTKRIKLTNYGLQLREKQRLRFMYGVSERQFFNTFKKASKMSGVTGNNFLFLLESRLDNVVYRMGFVTTRRASRQLVNHGHFLVNGKKVDIPSYTVKPGDIISLKEKSQELSVVNEAFDSVYRTPDFVDVDKKKKVGKYVRLPERNELNREVNELLIVEFYNR
ncbi:MAG: 30S ribosomal protein S4 [Breznakia sp.]